MAQAHTKIGTGAKAGIRIAAAMAAAAAGAYYFYGHKDATKHRRSMKSWMVKAKGDVMEKMEGLKEISHESYNEIVDQVITKYKKLKNSSPKELAALALELKGHWDKISAEAKKSLPKTKAKRAPAKKRA